MTATPSIACLGVIGKNNNPLHITIFPPHPPPSSSSSPSKNTTQAVQPVRTPLQFSLLLSSTLDIFEARSKSTNANLSGDYGLLHAVDERLAAYGFETNTGVRFVIVVDSRGRLGSGRDGLSAAGGGVRDGDIKLVFKAMQAAYVRLLQNPFYEPDEHSPPMGKGGRKITSRKFGEEMRRIGESWVPGIGTGN